MYAFFCHQFGMPKQNCEANRKLEEKKKYHNPTKLTINENELKKKRKNKLMSRKANMKVWMGWIIWTWPAFANHQKLWLKAHRQKAMRKIASIIRKKKCKHRATKPSETSENTLNASSYVIFSFAVCLPSTPSAPR